MTNTGVPRLVAPLRTGGCRRRGRHDRGHCGPVRQCQRDHHAVNFATPANPAGKQVYFRAVVKPPNRGVGRSGTVTFLDGATALAFHLQDPIPRHRDRPCTEPSPSASTHSPLSTPGTPPPSRLVLGRLMSGDEAANGIAVSETKEIRPPDVRHSRHHETGPTEDTRTTPRGPNYHR